MRMRKYFRFRYGVCVARAFAGPVLIGLLFAGMLFHLCGIEAHALELKDESERPDSYELLYVNTDTFLYEEADEVSTVLRELKKQELVVPVELGVPWVKVSIGELTGYVKSDYVQTESPDPRVAQELEEQAEYNAEFANEVERLTKEQRRSRIYGVLIICIIVGIFAAGIVSTVMGRRQEENKKARRKRDDESDFLNAKDDG